MLESFQQSERKQIFSPRKISKCQGLPPILNNKPKRTIYEANFEWLGNIFPTVSLEGGKCWWSQVKISHTQKIKMDREFSGERISLGK